MTRRSLRESLEEPTHLRTEAALTPGDAQARGLGLFHRSTGKYDTIVLFDPKKCIELLEAKNSRKVDPQMKKAIADLKALKTMAYVNYRPFFEEYLRIPESKVKLSNLARWLDQLHGYVKGGGYRSLRVSNPETWGLPAIRAFNKKVQRAVDKVVSLDPFFLRDGEDLNTYFPRAFIESMIGFLSYNRAELLGCDPDTWSVDLAAAEKGWGPLIYDLALSLIYPDFLVSDRTSVSKDAIRVWDYYFRNRTGDVEHIPVPRECETPMPPAAQDLTDEFSEYRDRIEDITEELRRLGARDPDRTKSLRDELKIKRDRLYQIRNEISRLQFANPLAFKYRIKKPIANYATLKTNSDQFIKELETRFRIKADSDLLRLAGENYFGQKYKD